MIWPMSMPAWHHCSFPGCEGHVEWEENPVVVDDDRVFAVIHRSHWEAA